MEILENVQIDVGGLFCAYGSVYYVCFLYLEGSTDYKLSKRKRMPLISEPVAKCDSINENTVINIEY